MKNLIAGFVVGALAGVTAGFLLAPESGNRLRKRLVKKAEKLSDRTADALETVGDRIGEVRRKLA